MSTIRGNYMGFIDFDGLRYWDIREKENIWFPIIKKGETSLPSDSTKRRDAIVLANGNIRDAQTMKEEIENLQRKDKKFRETVEKRRAEGGKKIVF